MRFFVGTQSLKFSQNQIHLVELDEERSYVNTRVFPHNAGEIWSVSPSPVSSDVISTCYNTLTGKVQFQNHTFSLFDYFL